jgi:hypothetical protein
VSGPAYLDGNHANGRSRQGLPRAGHQSFVHLDSTVFVPTSPEWSFLASNLVKEVATYGGDVSSLAPGFVHEQLVDRVARNTTHVR